MRDLYRKQWADPAGVRLLEVALFCDTDATGASSVAYFSTIKAEAGEEMLCRSDAFPGSGIFAVISRSCKMLQRVSKRILNWYTIPAGLAKKIQ